MNKLTEIKTIRFSKQQIKTLIILQSYSVDIPKFIRKSIAEKIKRDWHKIKEEKTKEYCPF